MPPPFRLLAITPPAGSVPAGVVSRWLDAGAGSTLGLLLREPGAATAELLAGHGRLAEIRRACVAAGIPVLLSIGPEDLGLPLPPDIAGLHLRGDPDLALLTRARERLARERAPDITALRDDPDLRAREHLAREIDPDGLRRDTDRAREPRLLPRDDPARRVLSDTPLRRPVGPAGSAPSTRLLGRSCHGEPQPGDRLVDYTLFAPVFAPTTAQPGRPLGSKIPAGIAALRAWTAAPGAAVFALGGVTPATAAACLEAGAHGLAGIGVFFGEPGQVAQDVAALREIVAASDRHVEPVSPR